MVSVGVWKVLFKVIYEEITADNLVPLLIRAKY